ncbi:hypothetical protein CEXT_361951 [Caerostris extrusa]|uniref:Uncharacterized protein n=1 Tax=Caerostris extrusa TaxID=172846 RepID=A0AAV4XXA1_CAEEX|nr:hypothetical protein CEXT_361951 [Caerostris extrusa]
MITVLEIGILFCRGRRAVELENLIRIEISDDLEWSFPIDVLTDEFPKIGSQQKLDLYPEVEGSVYTTNSSGRTETDCAKAAIHPKIWNGLRKQSEFFKINYLEDQSIFEV